MAMWYSLLLTKIFGDVGAFKLLRFLDHGDMFWILVPDVNFKI